MSEVLSIVGDSNVNRHLNHAKAAHPSDHSLRQSHLITAFNAEQLLSSLTGQNEHRRFVVIAALTNPITNLVFIGGDQLIIDVRLFLQQVSSWIQQGRNFDDGTNSSVFILPPQFRRYPSWYRQFYTNILAIFEDAFRAPSNNVWILPPFMDPEFEADGIHYTPASGLLYVQHLVHSTHLILESPSKPDPVAQSHSSQLQGVRYDISELRFSQMLINAKQEEETDGRLNTEAENQFVIAGLKIARSNSWQERQSSFVNATKELLVRFCPSLAAVSIKFCRVITASPRLFLNARVRCAVLKAYASAYLRENPQGQASVSSFTSRPHFTYRPSKTVRQISLTYCETVLCDELPEPTSSDVEQAYRIAGTRQYKGKLRETFLLLNDDHAIKPTKPAKSAKSVPKSNPYDVSDAKPSQDAAEPMEGISGQGSSGSQQSQAKPSYNTNKRKGSHGPSIIEGVHKLSRM